MKNEMTLQFSARSSNESFARAVAAAFSAQLEPSLEALSDIRTAVSEAVTNAIIHGYEQDPNAIVTMHCICENGVLTITVSDQGCGIQDIDQARKPFYTTKPELERSGMGFAVMEAFMDSVEVRSSPNNGTSVIMSKCILHGDG